MDTKIAHGGECPPGYIYDHNKNSPSYGRCISVVKKESGKKKPKVRTKLSDYAR